MRLFEKQKLTELVLYILNKTGGLDYYHLFKIIYFANIEHLAKYGMPIVSDKFCALPDGPVPSGLYNCIRGDAHCDKELSHLLEHNIVKGSNDAYYMLEAKRKADTDFLSRSEIEEIDRSLAENKDLPFGELREKSHGGEWRRAYYKQHGRKVMDIVGMAKDAKASDDMVEYIKEMCAIEDGLA